MLWKLLYAKHCKLNVCVSNVFRFDIDVTSFNLYLQYGFLIILLIAAQIYAIVYAVTKKGDVSLRSSFLLF